MTQHAPFRSHREALARRCLVVLAVELLPEVLRAVAHLLDRPRRSGTSVRRHLRAPRSGSRAVGMSASCQCRRRARSPAATPHRGRPAAASARSCTTPRCPLKRSISPTSYSRGRRRAGGTRRWPRARRSATAAAQVAGRAKVRRHRAGRRAPRCRAPSGRGCRWLTPGACAAGCSAAEDVEGGHLVDRDAGTAHRLRGSTQPSGRPPTTCAGITSATAATRSRSESGTWVATNTPRSIGRSSPFATSLRRQARSTPAASASCEP